MNAEEMEPYHAAVAAYMLCSCSCEDSVETLPAFGDEQLATNG